LQASSGTINQPSTSANNNGPARTAGPCSRSEEGRRGGHGQGDGHGQTGSHTGTHTGTLWSATGTQQATGTFTGESASGWQTLTFATPVSISANTQYVVSYHAPSGHYAADAGYFTNGGADAAPLHALSTSDAGGNGVYAYNATSTFPNQSFDDTNYWVDVVFSTPPTVLVRTPAAGATGVSSTTTITVTFDRAMDPTTITTSTFVLKDASGNVVAATVTYDASTNTATLTPTAPLNLAATYNVYLFGGTSGSRIRDKYGNYLTSNVTWSFTTGNS